MKRWVPLALVLLASNVAFSQPPRITHVEVWGCFLTDPNKVLQVAKVRQGDPFDKGAVEQALRQLGLFSQVTVLSTPSPRQEEVAVILQVEEQELPVPTTVEAAQVLNPSAVALQLVGRSLGTHGFTLRFKWPSFSLGFNWNIPAVTLVWLPEGKADWVPRYRHWTKTKGRYLRDALINELRMHLEQKPKDTEAQFALATLLDDTGQTEEALTLVENLLRQKPDFYPAYPLWLQLREQHALAQGKEGQPRALKNGQLLTFTFDQHAIAQWREALQRGEQMFRCLSRWDENKVIAAVNFYFTAMRTRFVFGVVGLLGERESEIELEGMEGQEVFQRLFTVPFTAYRSDFLRLSRIVERQVDTFWAHWVMAEWARMMMSASLLPHALQQVHSKDDPESEDDAEGMELDNSGTAKHLLRSLPQRYRPIVERWKVHIDRLLSLARGREGFAYAAIAPYHALVESNWEKAWKLIQQGIQRTPAAENLLLFAANTVMVVSLWQGVTPEGEASDDAMRTFVRFWADQWWQLASQVPRSRNIALTAVTWQIVAQSPPSVGVKKFEEWKRLSPETKQRLFQRLQNLAQRFPSSDAVHRLLGILALLDGDAETARAHFLRAQTLNPQNWDNRYALGLACLTKGETAEALRWWRNEQQTAQSCQ